MNVRTSQTKKNIMDAFWNLYRNNRIEKITVKEITQTAGYNRSTFYEYFIDVYDVLEHIENEVIPTKNELPPISIFDSTFGMPVDLFMNLYDQNSDYYFVLLGDNGDPAFAAKLKDAIKHMLIEFLTTEVNLSPIELDFTLEFILSAMIGIMSYWFKQDKILPADELFTLISDLMEKGIITKLNPHIE